MSGPKLAGAILISGRGSNMAALLDAARAPDYPVAFRLVLSNRADAPGLARAADRGLATGVIDARDTAAIIDALEAVGAELVCLAGYMRILPPAVVHRWPGRILNVHPSLLPAFPGLHAQAQALAAGVAESGATVHLVVEDLDAGPVVAQKAVPVLPGDDADRLSARILAVEHAIFPAAVAERARALLAETPG